VLLRLSASRVPHSSCPSDHLFPFPCSPTSHPVTRSVVNEPAAHITVRLCHAITAIPIGYYENSGTVSLSAFRPSHVSHRGNVLARRRCPIHDLECPRWASPIVQGVPRAKLGPVAHDGVGVQTCYRRVCSFHHWSLGFGWVGTWRVAVACTSHTSPPFRTVHTTFTVHGSALFGPS
jgi:hypothetical protein